MKSSKYIGLSALFLGLVALYPEFKKISKTKNVKSYSKKALWLSVIGSLLWLTFHVIEKQPINALAVIFYLAMDIYTISLFQKDS
jgi:uncharacterized protein with PQ loop repeat